MPAPWEQDYGGDQSAAKPWERDYIGEGKEDFFHPAKPAPGSGWTGVGQRILQYPRIFAGKIIDAGETLGKVSRGELDAASPEAVAAATDVASMAGPAGEFAGTGGQIARRAFAPGAPNPSYVAPTAGLRAAQTAVDVGSPLPAGIVSQTPMIQATTQGFRQVPFVGPTITESVGNTVKAAGGHVSDIAEQLSGGPVSDRSTVGANTKAALGQVIEDNNATIDAAYDNLRNNTIDPDGTGPLPRTQATLNAIKNERAQGGMTNPSAGLSDIENLVSQDRSFNGLVRARSDVGQMVRASKDNPNPGFVPGDFKRIYGSMTSDLENVVRANARPGISPDDAADAFKFANGQAKDLIERNGNIARLIGKTSDEGLLGRIIHSAKDKTGNLRLLGELRVMLPSPDFEKIAGIALHELGHTPEGFSLNRFAGKQGWGGLGDSAKSVLIADPNHRKALDDIADLGSFLKDADKYRNTSNTAHGAGIVGSIAALGEAVRDPEQIPHMLAVLAGGYGISRILGRPASASALRKWLTIAKDKASGRYGPARAAAALGIASRNLANNLPEPSNVEPPKKQPLHVTVHPRATVYPKAQGRVVSPVYPPPLQQ